MLQSKLFVCTELFSNHAMSQQKHREDVDVSREFKNEFADYNQQQVITSDGKVT